MKLARKPGYRMRPSPSDILPPLELIEYPDKRYDPSMNDRNPRRLRKIIGGHYNAAFMSVDRPAVLKSNSSSVYGKITKLIKYGDVYVPKEIKKFGRMPLPGGHTLRLRTSRRVRKKLTRYLLAYTYCPVKYEWKDLGIRFWPRWIRTGSCYNGRSCSIPAGMSCKVKDSTKLTILRWLCRKWENTTWSCIWIQIQYPIVTSCSCAC
ncbi:noggin-2-like [Tubulanus polymorphus]|uniref:noggin-2-like n=1 Tax=Tubulanus polymorphus TaxID=672921 RepID=UPI003DA4AEF7